MSRRLSTETTKRNDIERQNGFQEAVIRRFDTPNQEKIAIGYEAKWRQLKNAATFKDLFLRITLDIPKINVEDHIDS